MKLIALFAFVLLAVNVARAEEFIYKFGVDTGRVLHTGDGNIALLKYKTEVPIPVPRGATVTYVEVIVDAVSPPKVSYDTLLNKVHIDFSWTQITLSSYRVMVKGI